MRRGDLATTGQPVIGFDVSGVVLLPREGMAARAWRALARSRAAEVSTADHSAVAAAMIASLRDRAVVEIVTWGPEDVLRSKLREVTLRPRIFPSRHDVARYVMTRSRMLYYVTADSELAAMIPSGSGVEAIVFTDWDALPFIQQLIRTRHRGR